jgi:threonine/homoserine/homoserine lactone efflux protein
MDAGNHTVCKLRCQTVLLCIGVRRLHYQCASEKSSPATSPTCPCTPPNWTALLALLHRHELFAGAQHHAVDRAGGQPRPAPALRFCLAVPAGWVLLMLACGLGLGALVLGVPTLRWGVKLLGVGYMVWLAWKLSGAAPCPGRRRKLTISFLGGVGLQFVNIKAWMLALTLTAGWVVSALGAPATNPGERLAIICAVMVVFAFTSNFTYA